MLDSPTSVSIKKCYKIVETGKIWNTWAGAVFISKEDHQ